VGERPTGYFNGIQVYRFFSKLSAKLKKCSFEHFQIYRIALIMASPLVEKLRRELRDQFPEAHGSCLPAETVQVPVVQFSMESFPTGAISEVVSAGTASGVSLPVVGILNDPEVGVSFPEVVLIDGVDHFDPGSFSGASCSRLLWIR
jgi:hypothetical protein